MRIKVALSCSPMKRRAISLVCWSLVSENPIKTLKHKSKANQDNSALCRQPQNTLVIPTQAFAGVLWWWGLVSFSFFFFSSLSCLSGSRLWFCWRDYRKEEMQGKDDWYLPDAVTKQFQGPQIQWMFSVESPVSIFLHLMGAKILFLKALKICL